MSERYEIRRKIGQGGLGTVYQAYDSHLKRDVAIKRLFAPVDAAGNVNRDATVEKLMNEATALSSLNHQNIVSVFDVGQDEDGGYVVMELLDGETLTKTIKKATLTLQDFHLVVIQTLEALITAGAASMLHRDLKPSNIMVIWLPSGRFLVKILDFGLAKVSAQPVMQTIDQNNSVLGSIFYMAPEQFERKELTFTTDLYSMGCIYYFTLTGKDPFTGSSVADVMEAHLKHRVVPLHEMRPDLPAPLCDWVMWLLRRDPAARPQTAKEALDNYPLTEDSSGAVHVATDRNFSIPADVSPAATAAPPAQPASDPATQPAGVSGPIPTQATTTTRIPSARTTTVPTTLPAKAARHTSPQKTVAEPSRSPLPVILGVVGALALTSLILIFALRARQNSPSPSSKGGKASVAAKSSSSQSTPTQSGKGKSGASQSTSVARITPVPVANLEPGDELHFSFTVRKRSKDLLRFALLSRNPAKPNLYNGYSIDVKQQGPKSVLIRRYEDFQANNARKLLPGQSTTLPCSLEGKNVMVGNLVKLDLTARLVSPSRLEFLLSLWDASGAKATYKAHDSSPTTTIVEEYGLRGHPDILDQLANHRFQLAKDPKNAFAATPTRPKSSTPARPMELLVEDGFNFSESSTKGNDKDDPLDVNWSGPVSIRRASEEQTAIDGSNALQIPTGKTTLATIPNTMLHPDRGTLQVDLDLKTEGNPPNVRLALVDRIEDAQGYLIELSGPMKIKIFEYDKGNAKNLSLQNATLLVEQEPKTSQTPQRLGQPNHLTLKVIRKSADQVEVTCTATNKRGRSNSATFLDDREPDVKFTRFGILSSGKKGRCLIDNVRIQSDS